MNLDPVVLITGGGRGLERAFAQAQAGAKVAVTARSAAELAQTVELIEQASAPMNDYVVASPQVRERAPAVQQWFQQLYREGYDTPIERAVEFLVALALGRADALSGCYLSVNDDLEALLAQAEPIQREQRRTLRLYV